MAEGSAESAGLGQWLARSDLSVGVRLRARTDDGTVPSPPPSADAPASVARSLGRYPITGHLGEGGMGEVLEVQDPDLGRHIAAKLIRGESDRRSIEKFVLEAQVTGQLEHPNIVPVYELGLAAGERIYFTMKRVQGEDLGQLLERERERSSDGAPSPNLAQHLRTFLKVCDALAYAHSRGVIHRDLKPSNIMVGRFGEVQVMDWGLAAIRGAPSDPAARDLRLDVGRGRISELARGGRDVEPIKTMSGEVLGTPAYMPPEQALGEIELIDQRADIYALGAMLYEIVTGHPPYESINGYLILLELLEGPPERPSVRAPSRRVPWELEAVITKAMARKPAERYASVEALRSDVERFLAGGVLGAVRYTTRQLVVKWIGRHRGLVAALAGLVAALSLLLGYYAADTVERARLAGRYEQQRDQANRQERAAARQRDEAAEARTDLLRMSDLHRLARLLAWGDELWPAHRRMAPAYRSWQRSARKLLENLPGHRRSLELLRRQEGRRTGADRWQFSSDEQQWVHDNLARLVAGLERLQGPDGMLADVGKRMEWAATLWQRSVEAHRGRWERAVREIRDSSRYRGLTLQPQEGLVPIGPDPGSGLWEFVHIGSGEFVERLPGGRLLFDERSGIVLVLLPGGTFHMGARRDATPGPNVDPSAWTDVVPVHTVELAPLFLSKYEMTQAQWQRLTGRNPSYWRPGGTASRVITALHPVERVSWLDCRETLRRAGLALPSEAQWEYAARAGTRTRWWTGDDPTRLADAGNVADQLFAREFRAARYERWKDGHEIHAPVWSYRANPFGLHGVIGNVAEWCSDPYHAKAYGAPLLGDGSGRRRFPENWPVQRVPLRVKRGGALNAPAYQTSSSFRDWEVEDSRGNTQGCRPMRAVERGGAR